MSEPTTVPAGEWKLETIEPAGKGRQRAFKFSGQPPARWAQFINLAHRRINDAGGFKGRKDPVAQLAAAIVKGGDGEAFLKAARRGRPTARQNLRYQLLREVEAAVGAGVPRRREDRNTPEAAPRVALEMT